MTAVCGEDGEWRPNPGDVECRNTTEDSSTCKAYCGVFVCELEFSLQAFNDLLKHKNILVSALLYHPLSNEESIQLGDFVWLHELLEHKAQHC